MKFKFRPAYTDAIFLVGLVVLIVGLVAGSSVLAIVGLVPMVAVLLLAFYNVGTRGRRTRKAAAEAAAKRAAGRR